MMKNRTQMMLASLQEALIVQERFKNLKEVRYAKVESEEYAVFIFPNTVYSLELDWRPEVDTAAGIVDFLAAI